MTKLLAAAAALTLAAGTASAATLAFSEDFDDAALGGNATDLGGQFVVAGGSVDVIGPGFADFYPNNGNYIDLNGSTNEAGTIEADAAALGLTVGKTYTLSFDYAFNANSGFAGEALSYSVGNLSGTVDLDDDPTGTVTTTFLYTGGSLLFADAGGAAEAADNGGPVLLSVSIAAVPLPAAGLLLLGALGAVGLGRRRKAA